MHDITERGTAPREDRSFTVTDLEVRADDDAGVTFEGVASTVDQPYQVTDPFGEFTETIVRGAFSKTLKERDDVMLLVNHRGTPLARTKSGTLTLRSDPDLRAGAKLDPANPKVQEIRSAMARGDLDQMSIGFKVTRQEWNDDYSQRWIREVRLFDVSIVNEPANPATSASLRALDEAVRTLTDGQTHDPEMIERAIAHLQSLLPAAEAPVESDQFDEERLARLIALWDKRIPA